MYCEKVEKIEVMDLQSYTRYFEIQFLTVIVHWLLKMVVLVSMWSLIGSLIVVPIWFQFIVGEMCHPSRIEPDRLRKLFCLCDGKCEPNWIRMCSQESEKLIQDCLGDLESSIFRIIMQKQGLQFRKCRLVNNRSMNYIGFYSEQISSYFSFPISSLTRVSSKSSMFYDIDQLQEYVGRWSSSSSEDR
jgi:hypothetical protein